MKKIVAVIPARYESSRFPGKPLAQIAGKPMIQYVYESAKQVDEFSDIIIATDDIRIKEVAESFGGKVVMTGDCACGTERVYEASQKLEADIVINIQGDEPLLKKEMIFDLLKAFEDESVIMATLKREIMTEEEVENPNVVKVVADKNNDALYFSRQKVPFVRDHANIKYYKHIGMYGYTKSFLKEYVLLPTSSLEEAEKLEQLRVLENGYKIRVLETKCDTIGVDTPEQLQQVEKIILEKI